MLLNGFSALNDARRSSHQRADTPTTAAEAADVAGTEEVAAATEASAAGTEEVAGGTAGRKEAVTPAGATTVRIERHFSFASCCLLISCLRHVCRYFVGLALEVCMCTRSVLNQNLTAWKGERV